MFESWRGVLGDIKPTHRPGSLEEFIRLLPEGIGVIPMTVGIRSGTEKEFYDVLADYQAKAGELAELGVNLIHIGGAPPMMVHGFAGEAKIVKDMEAKQHPCQHLGQVASRCYARAGRQKIRRGYLFQREPESNFYPLLHRGGFRSGRDGRD